MGIRLKAVEQMLPLAAGHAEEDVEYVHQLRVATRRADAALRLFRPLAGPARWKKTRRRLRRIRQAAGDARDCDVHLELLRRDREQADLVLQPVFDDVAAWTEICRAAAQEAINDVAGRYPKRVLRRGRRRLLSSLRPRREQMKATLETDCDHPRLADLAAASLPRLLRLVQNTAAKDLEVLDNLHDLRICAKRLRYAMEIFGSCLGPSFQDDYALVQSMQEELGAINDSHVMMDRVRAFARAIADPAAADETAPLSGDLGGLLEHYRSQRHERIRRFLDDWAAGTWSRLLELTLEPTVDRDAAGAAS
jgi:CHAD domain-containing protein